MSQFLYIFKVLLLSPCNWLIVEMNIVLPLRYSVRHAFKKKLNKPKTDKTFMSQ